ncbi:MAG: translation initiation factor IF-2 [Candidatus Thermoplasmatota archaeon]|nr:translation initiation factor IF-2 [Candidatus Thermoplasmatota archaeon]MBS3801787.1 translation initiation factor IF-2 [Candidatus Thermoplasmatota archaeon]
MPQEYIRQPIVSVLGHVDHGKTTLLDYIRGTAVASRESGAITQHIGATEIPIDAIKNVCGNLLTGKSFSLPGLLFIDTPGHHAFTTLRSRGGSLADIAILIVDITEGFKPQTYESINILKQYKTPFIIAANKIDSISGWQKNDVLANQRIDQQPLKIKNVFEENLYQLIGDLYDEGLQADLYYKIQDFRKTIGIVPISAKTGEGINELLMTLVGLAQRFLEDQLQIETGPAKGTILEVKEEIGMGTTIDTIIYNGVLRNTDTIAIGTKTDPVVTTIKALLKPKPLDEIRDPRERFSSVKEVSAAAGIKISSPNLEDVIPGAPIRVCNENQEEIVEEIKKQTHIDIQVDEEGLLIKADTIGSLEALIKESKEKGIKIRKAEIGNVSKRDITEAAATTDPFNKVIFAFNIKILPEAKEELKQTDVTVFNDPVIYTIMEKYDEWYVVTKDKLEKQRRQTYMHPGMIKILPEFIFRVSNPAIFGVRVLAGRIHSDLKLMREDGRVIGRIKGIQEENQSVDEAKQGAEVAVSVDGITIGRQVKGGDILYTDLPEDDAKKLRDLDVLTFDEKEVLEKIFEIKRKTEKFWGI